MRACRDMMRAMVVACALLVPEASPSDSPSQSQPEERQALALVLHAAGRPQDSLEALPGQLRALGGSAAGGLLDAAAHRRFTIDAGLEQPLTISIREDLRAAILQGLGLLPRSEILPLLASIPATEQNLELREAALLVWGGAGGPGDFQLLVSLARSHERGEPSSPGQRANFETALGSLLKRQRIGRSALRTLFQDAGPGLSMAMLRAIEDAMEPEALEVTAQLLGLRTEDDLLLLQRLEHLAQRRESLAPGRVGELVRPYLDDARSEVALMAARAAAALEDVESVPGLVNLLGRPAVAKTARAALHRLTRTDFGEDGAEWLAWYESENRAWALRSAAGLRDLSDGDPVDAVAALRELARCRLHRHEASAVVERALWHDEPGIAALACRVLGHLASPTAIPALEDALQHVEPEVSDAARAAIQRIDEMRRKPSPRRNAG